MSGRSSTQKILTTNSREPAERGSRPLLGDDAPERARTTGKSYAFLDDPAFVERNVSRGEDGKCSIDLYLEGVHCAACVWLVEKLPAVAEGAVEARLDIRGAVAEFSFPIIRGDAFGR